MKRTIIPVLAVGIGVGGLYCMNRTPALPDPLPAPMVQSVASETPAKMESRPPETQQPAPAAASAQPVQAAPSAKPVQAAPTPKPNPDSSSGRWDDGRFHQSLELLLSPHVAYGQKQNAWKEILARGMIDQAISELEEGLAADPQAAGHAAALAQAYFKKCGVVQDVRDQAMLAMQADKLLDSALAIDPSHWEARYTKAVAMSHWPASMNKGEEVMQHFTTLIQQQEAQPPQPHFASSYVLLGNQYERSGQANFARMVWERGATLFPNDQALNQKLSASPARPAE